MVIITLARIIIHNIEDIAHNQDRQGGGLDPGGQVPCLWALGQPGAATAQGF